MIIISDYELIEKTEKQVFYVRSMEQPICPICKSDRLEVIGSRPRICREKDGECTTLIIRRLRCEECRKIHHELPYILVPYKRYKSECIEAVAENDNRKIQEIGCDESTLHRWKKWFTSLSEHMAGSLQSIEAQMGKETEGTARPQSALPGIWSYVGDAAGWLARTVRALVNANLWVQTRSAFLSG
jgi:hypothetical protein